MSNTVPEGWALREAETLYTRLRVPRVYDRNQVSPAGKYPVIDQSESGCIGYLNSNPEFSCDEHSPLTTFANHTCAVRQMKKPFGVIQNVFPLKAQPDVSQTFLFQILHGAIPQDGYKGHYPQLRETQFLTPPLPEQQKIAAILSSFDDVIEKTRAQIDKLKDLKTGMMQELLTKGIGSGGVPHSEFKDSPVGRIPVSWNVVELGEIAKQVKPGPFGSSLTKAMYVEKGYKVYGQEQVISGDFKLGDYYIDEAKYDELAAFKVASGDILISLVGTFGQVAVVPEAFEAGIINPRLLKIRFPSIKMDAEYSAQQLRSDFVLNQLKQLQQGGTMGVLSATTVKPVKLIVPPLEEQKVIGNAVHSIDSVISTKLDELRSVQKLKKSLMQDLLTGKVRVNTDQRESVVA